MTTSAVVVRPIAENDRAAWEPLFAGYRDFYEMADDATVLATVWSWLHDPGHEVGGIVAEIDGEIVGLTHFRRFARPFEGGYATWLDDLFTTPEARGRGVARALIGAVTEIASARGDRVVRWHTARDNSTARRVYDELAVATRWVTYDRAT